ncbi:hypothetical protein AB8A69_09640 [Bacillus tropicus]
MQKLTNESKEELYVQLGFKFEMYSEKITRVFRYLELLIQQIEMNA